MAANISLQKSVRTCRVDSGWAPRIQSDRFENSNSMMCPVWNERDLTGRKVCADSFWTKREGCNSATDRISVENGLRPQYMEYVTLDAAGIDGNMYLNNENIGVTESFVQPRRGNVRHSPKMGRIPENYAVGVYGYSSSPMSSGPTESVFESSAQGAGCGASRIGQNQQFYADAVRGCQTLENIKNITGQFGQNDFVGQIYPTCGIYAYESSMASVAQQQRARQSLNQGGKSERYRAYAKTAGY
ncbi:Uncharacterised protein [uncultured archaeon]|nr:Uncharacterised protein [uncultured archaeon]